MHWASFTFDGVSTRLYNKPSGGNSRCPIGSAPNRGLGVATQLAWPSDVAGLLQTQSFPKCHFDDEQPLTFRLSIYSTLGDWTESMKRLSIMRHAKAAVAGTAQADFDRALTKRGTKDTQGIARTIGRGKLPVDWIVASPALRTQMTAEILSEALAFTGTIQWDDRAYLGDAETWLLLLSKVPPEIQHVAIVGHNPGMADLVAGLTTGASPRLNLHFPTAAVAHLEMEIFWWNQIRWGCGQLRWLITPKILR